MPALSLSARSPTQLARGARSRGRRGPPGTGGIAPRVDAEEAGARRGRAAGSQRPAGGHSRRKFAPAPLRTWTPTWRCARLGPRLLTGTRSSASVSPQTPYLLQATEAVLRSAQQRAQLQQPRGQRQVLRRGFLHGRPADR